MNTKRNHTLQKLYQYTSFISFLKDWIDEEQATKRNFTLMGMAKSMGLSHTASLSNILKGRRIANAETISKFKALVDLERSESLYIDIISEKDRHLDNEVLSLALNLTINNFKQNTLNNSTQSNSVL